MSRGSLKESMTDGFEPFEIDERRIKVLYPNSGNAGWHIRNILSGKDYPVLRTDGFDPEYFVDIGANVGATSLLFAARYPKAEVLCFEPSPSNFSYLERNIGSVLRISAFNFGLGDREKQTKLFLGRSQCLQHSIFSSVEVRDEYELVAIKRASLELQKLVRGRCILKIDTEGCEVPILRDLDEFLVNVDVLYLEYHSESDRLGIDQMLRSGFKLWHSSATTVHRGNLAYLSYRILSRFPELEKWEIKR